MRARGDLPGSEGSQRQDGPDPWPAAPGGRQRSRQGAGHAGALEQAEESAPPSKTCLANNCHRHLKLAQGSDEKKTVTTVKKEWRTPRDVSHSGSC
jgi:hypothetical protein